MNLSSRVALFAFVYTPVCLAADTVALCGPEVKVIKVALPDEYYPQPCWKTPFDLVVELTVGVDGRAHDPTLLSGLENSPDDKRSCIEHMARKLVLLGTTFPKVQTPCRYRLHIKAVDAA